MASRINLVKNSVALENEPTTILLLNGHSIKLPSKYIYPCISTCLYIQRSVQPSGLSTLLFPQGSENITEEGQKDCKRQRLGTTMAEQCP